MELNLSQDTALLVGRDSELKALHQQLLKDNDDGGQFLVLIRGASGTGKSTLLQAFAKTQSSTRNDSLCLLTGKFEEDTRLPFSALVHCLEDLCMQLLEGESTTSTQKNVVDWRQVLWDELPSELETLATLCPRFLQFAQEEEEAKHASAAAAAVTADEALSTTSSTKTNSEDPLSSQHGFERLQLAFISLVRVLSSHFKSLLLLLDDLQWADEGSIQLLTAILGNTPYQGRVLILCSHRPFTDQETSHRIKTPLVNRAPKCLDLTISNLSIANVETLLGHCLGLGWKRSDALRELAHALHRKTAGNPLFVVQMIRLWHSQKLVYYDLSTCRWEWNMHRIRSETDVTDNVAQAIAQKLELMPPHLQRILSEAAFLGPSHIHVSILSKVMIVLEDVSNHPTSNDNNNNNNIAELETLLDQCAEEGFLEKLTVSGTYKFAHDQIREIARTNSMVGENGEQYSQETLTLRHLKTGRALSQVASDPQMDEATSEGLVLLAVQHWNKGRSQISDTQERIKLSELNHLAGEIAFRKSSYALATEFLETGIELLGRDEDTRWAQSQYYPLTLQLMSDGARAHMCRGQTERSRELADEVLRRALSVQDKIPVFYTLVCLLCSQKDKADEAIALLLDTLGTLGVKMPKRHLKWNILRKALFIHRKISKFSPEDFLQSPEMETSAESVAVLDFLRRLNTLAASAGNEDYVVLSTMQLVLLTLQSHGRSEISPLCLCFCGLMFGIQGDFDRAVRYADVAVQLAEGGDRPQTDAFTVLMCHGLLIHWRKPYYSSLVPVARANETIQRLGAAEDLFFGCFFYSLLYFCAGLDLRPLEKDARRSIELLQGYGQTHYLAIYQPVAQMVMNLTEESSASRYPMTLTGYAMDEQQFRKDWAASRHDQAMEFFYLCKAALALYLSDFELAESTLILLDKSLGSAEVLPTIFLKCFYSGIVSFARAKDTGLKKYIRKGQLCLRKLERYYRQGNINCYHMVLILRAELSSCRGGKAKVDYEKAAVATARQGFLHHAALANERAGAYSLKNGDLDSATSFLTRAYDLYGQWGAAVKVRQMEDRYSNYLDQSLLAPVGERKGTSLKARRTISSREYGTEDSSSFHILYGTR